MSVKMMGAVIDCGPQDRTQFCVMVTLANNSDDFGFACPALSTIAANARCDEKTVRRTIKDLVTNGWLYVARKVLNGKCNVYFINLEKIGVTVPTDARRSPMFMRVLKSSPGMVSPIFCAKKSPGMDEFSEDNSQPSHRTFETTHRTSDTQIPGIACPTNRKNRKYLEPLGTVDVAEPSPLPPQVGDNAGEASTTPETKPDDTASREASAHLVAAFSAVKRSLKRDVGTTHHPNFTEIVPGRSDYDSCFRDWWLFGLERKGTEFIFVTHAVNADATAEGIAKYRGRLETALRAYFPIPKTANIQFNVQQRSASTEAA